MKAFVPLFLLTASLMAAPLVQTNYLKAFNPDSQDSLASAVAVDGDTLVVGAAFESGGNPGVNPASNNAMPGAGAVYVYVREGSSWKQQAYLKASNPGEGDNFGAAVALSGNTLVVGAPFEDSLSNDINGSDNDDLGDSGAAYVFVRTGSTWTQQAYVKPSSPGQSDRFGASVGISQDSIVVGASFDDSDAVVINGNPNNNLAPNSGAAYVFTRSAGIWSQQAYLKPTNANAGDRFGQAVAISGERVVVGAIAEASNATGVNGNQANNTLSGAGAAYVFLRTGLSWSQQAYLKASNTGGGDNFGNTVAISGDTVVVAATYEDGSNTGVNPTTSEGTSDSGAAYVFFHNGVSWSQQAYIKAPAVSVEDFFGTSVAVDGDSLVVGSPFEDSAASGVNGNVESEAAINAGAAFRYTRNGGVWQEADYLKASNPGPIANFGQSVGVSGDVVVVGSPGEDGSGRGTNPKVTTTADAAGAAYVFEAPPELYAVAHSGYRAPGGIDLFFGKASVAAITENPSILFEAPLVGTGAAGGKNLGLFSSSTASPDETLVMQKGTPLAGALGLPQNAKLTGLSNPLQNQGGRGLFIGTVSGTGITAAGNRVLFCDTPQGVSAIFWNGSDVPALSDYRLRTMYEVLQHQVSNSIFLPYKLGKGAVSSALLANADSGILRIDHAGVVQDISIQEGNAADANGKIGQVRPNASVTSHPQTWFIAKYAFNNPQDGAPYDSLYRNSSAVPIVPGAPAATPLAPSAVLGTMLSVTAQTGHGIFRNALKNAPATQNEALYRTDGTSTFDYLLQKGSPLNPVPGDPALTPTKILRYWAVGSDQVVVHMQVSGTAKNNEALVLLQGNGFSLTLLRKGDPAPGMHPGVTISKLNVVDVEHGNGNYFVLATLAGISSSGNQALFKGSTSAGDDAFTYPLRRPELVLRKGGIYTTADTPVGTVRSISIKPAPDTTGVGARGLREVIGGNEHIAVTITGDRGSSELVVVKP